MTWGMLPLHASGVAACTYHVFYNSPSLQVLVSTQAGLTLLGNITLMIAAGRIAVSNGWNIGELNPMKIINAGKGEGDEPSAANEPTAAAIDRSQGNPDEATLTGATGGASSVAAMAITPYEKDESDALLVAKLAFLTVSAAYLVKYGELALSVPFEPSVAAGIVPIVLAPAAVSAYYFNYGSKDAGADDDGSPKKMVSFDDVKKFGVAGTIAYVATELAFWAVAFPFAGYALYNTTGHWPDFLNSGSDRAAVLGFIFAGANVARLAVPVRMGAAIALAPWVERKFLGGKEGEGDEN